MDQKLDNNVCLLGLRHFLQPVITRVVRWNNAYELSGVFLSHNRPEVRKSSKTARQI
jgi:hypothetical protein